MSIVTFCRILSLHHCLLMHIHYLDYTSLVAFSMRLKIPLTVGVESPMMSMLSVYANNSFGSQAVKSSVSIFADLVAFC